LISIGIIANPASGKDIRRLVSHATIIDNNEKINIVERIVLGAQALGVERVYMMPDSYNMGYRAEDNLNICNELKCEINVINIMRFDGMEDTISAVKFMEDANIRRRRDKQGCCQSYKGYTYYFDFNRNKQCISRNDGRNCCGHGIGGSRFRLF